MPGRAAERGTGTAVATLHPRLNRHPEPPLLGFDLIIPIGAVVVICFSLGSIFFDGRSHFGTGPPEHVLKAYRKDASAVIGSLLPCTLAVCVAAEGDARVAPTLLRLG